jgi:uncharacterized integral membrane protein (TIGR00698 family)
VILVRPRYPPPLAPGATTLRQLVPGILVAVGLALLANFVADAVSDGVAGLPKIPSSPVLCAVLLGMLWRNTIGVPAACTEGLNLAMHGLLRTGIALVGLKLTLTGATAIAVTALPVAVGCILTALVAGAVITKVFGVPKRLAMLLAVGTAVCGCTAVVAMSPVIRAKHVETFFAVTCVVLFGSVAMVFYPWIAHYFFASSPVHAGIFLGTAIHDTSQVIGSALIYSQQLAAPDALSAASVAKLLRNLSIIVLIPAAAWLTRSDDGEASAQKTSFSKAVPLFVIAFLLFVLLRTLGDAFFHDTSVAQQWGSLVGAGSSASQLLLTCGMTAVGLSVSFSQMRSVGWRPLAAGFAIATVVGCCSLTLTRLTQYLAQ